MSTNYQTSSVLLQGEYQYAFQKIELYVLSENLPYFISMEMLEEVVDVLLSAQQDQTPIHDILGEDILKFCEQITNNYQPTLLHRIANTLSWSRFYFLILGYIGGIGCIALSMSQDFSIWKETIEIASFICSLVIANIVFIGFHLIAKKYFYHQRWYTKNVNNIFTWSGLLISAVLIIMIQEKVDLSLNIPNYIFIPFTFIFSYFIRRYSIKENKKYSIFYINFYNASIQKYRNRHQKYLRKCMKKHIEPKNLKFWILEDNKKERWRTYQSLILVYLLISFYVYLNASLYDAFCFFIILILSSFPILKCFQYFHSIDQDVIQEMEALQTDIYDDALLKESDV